jgi:hypothetical protein
MYFEYFGWDDPVTSVANFVLHPGMELTDQQYGIYTQRLAEHFGAVDEARAKALLPLYAVRWCAIILGDLLPERRQHRVVAAGGAHPWDQVRELQLQKARRLLSRFTGSAV